VSIDNQSQSAASSQQSNPPIPPLLKGGKGELFSKRGIGGLPKLSKLRRFVLLGIMLLFLLQFLKIKVLVGGLTGSLAVWFVKLIDVFAYFESLVASKDFTTTAFIAVLPIIGIYLIFGRAFCGWICPMDFLYEMMDKLRGNRQWAIGNRIKRISPKIGYGIAGVLLVVSALVNIPFFTNYISHLTNFFRFITGSVFLALDLPFEPSVLAYSGSIIILLLGLEYFFPRLWCKVLCPVGKTYGLFNKISLIRLKFVEGECGECNLCEQLCYMNVKIARYIDRPDLRDTNCIYCGRCVEGCETKGRLIKIGFKKNKVR
jgi:ferredoxin-type protein NapH